MPDEKKLTDEEQAKLDAEKGKGAVSAEEFKSLVDTVKLLATNSEQTNTGLATLVTRMNKDSDLQQRHQEQQQQQQQKRDDELDPQALESMNREEYMTHIMGEFTKVLDEKMGTVNASIEKQSLRTTAMNLKDEVGSVRKANADFDDWKDEMKLLAADHPHLRFEDLYLKARHQDPEKATKLDLDIKEAALGTEQQGGANGAKRFGGNHPGTSIEDEVRTDMTRKEAGEAAYEEIMAGLDMIDHSSTANPTG